MATNLLILIGIGCLVMGVILLSQEPIIIKEREVETETETKTEERSFDDLKPVTKRADRIWMQETREQSHQVRPYPVF